MATLTYPSDVGISEDHDTLMATTDRGPLGPVLIRLRGNTTQQELARASGVKSGMIAHIETGYRNASVDTITRLAKALKLTKAQRDELLTAREKYPAWEESQARNAEEPDRSGTTDYNSRLARMPDHVLQAVNDIIDAEERRRGLA